MCHSYFLCEFFLPSILFVKKEARGMLFGEKYKNYSKTPHVDEGRHGCKQSPYALDVPDLLLKLGYLRCLTYNTNLGARST